MKPLRAYHRVMPTAQARTGYLPSLDGWRAIAVLGVMMTHDRDWAHANHLSLYTAMGYGGHGVYLFFAISGFLITTRILEEEALCGHFDIRRFYIRRVFRIQPAALAYLAAAALLMLAGLSHDSWFSWVAALCLFTNFIWRPWTAFTLTGHFWTLAVEEHFYILLSLALFFAKKHRLLVIGLLYCLVLMPNMVSYPQRHGWWTLDALRSTQFQLVTLMLAALLAVLLRRPLVLRTVQRLWKPWVALLVIAAVVVLHNAYGQMQAAMPIRPLRYLHNQTAYFVTYMPPFFVVATVFHPRSWTTRWLELRWMRFIGKISYSLYLWHILIFYLWSLLFFAPTAPLASLLQQGGPLPWLEKPVKYAIVFGVATLSYYFIEKPLIRRGHQLAPPATPGRPEFADLPTETA
jgi:peptidoglycan/LPS O-acetylase OafA/YrhL